MVLTMIRSCRGYLDWGENGEIPYDPIYMTSRTICQPKMHLSLQDFEKVRRVMGINEDVKLLIFNFGGREFLLGVGLPVQVKNIGFRGVFRLIFKPLVTEFRCFGAASFSLRNKFVDEVCGHQNEI
ncbi:hypothetical protein L1987_18674 [Smallanthus sonchifolius]|uniref:Uncharacterized protein n=1 Tax=Smallanthus sonchifolius TaxID=185202 RepID=A0ACB9J090_9ASTR|nr:hypothetical protein L1987_18674 [Smallanthus sonchifolius]